MKSKEFIREAGTRAGALNTVVQLKSAIENGQGSSPHEVDLLKRQMNALIRKYKISPEELNGLSPVPKLPMNPSPNANDLNQTTNHLHASEKMVAANRAALKKAYQSTYMPPKIRTKA